MSEKKFDWMKCQCGSEKVYREASGNELFCADCKECRFTIIDKPYYKCNKCDNQRIYLNYAKKHCYCPHCGYDGVWDDFIDEEYRAKIRKEQEIKSYQEKAGEILIAIAPYLPKEAQETISKIIKGEQDK